jgi:hypothetical protein
LAAASSISLLSLATSAMPVDEQFEVVDGDPKDGPTTGLDECARTFPDHDPTL